MIAPIPARNSAAPAEPADPVDLVVVGGGVIGLFTAISAATKGHSVTLVEQFDLPHKHGSSHGDSRIYRMAYEETLYLDMMALSLPIWRALQTEASDTLLVETGCLALARNAPSGALIPRLAALRDVYIARGLAHAVLDAAAIAHRFPQFNPPDNVSGVHVDKGGVLFAARCLEAVLARARALGIRVRTKFKAIALELPSEDRDAPLALRAECGAVVLAKRCVIAPGAWLRPVAKRLLGLHLSCFATEETVSYYAPRDEAGLGGYDVRSGMPAFIYFSDGVVDHSTGEVSPDVYGIPSTVIPGVKVAAHYFGPRLGESDVDVRATELSQKFGEATQSCGGDGGTWLKRPDRIEKIGRSMDAATKFVRDFMSGLEAEPIQSSNCLCTRTGDSHFVVDVAGGTAGRVVLAGVGSGHAFKLAPAIGECAVALVFGLQPPVHLSKMALERMVDDQNSGKSKSSAPS